MTVQRARFGSREAAEDFVTGACIHCAKVFKAGGSWWVVWGVEK